MTHVQKGEKTATRGDLDTEVIRTFDNEVFKLFDGYLNEIFCEFRGCVVR